MSTEIVNLNVHPLREGWNPDLSDLNTEELEKVEKVSSFLDRFLERAESQNNELVYIEQTVSFNFKTGEFTNRVSFEDYLKYLKGSYANKERFLSRWVSGVKGDFYELCAHFGLNFLETFKQRVLDAWNEASPFTYEEAFKISDDGFRALVFGTISITEMIEKLNGVSISSAEKTTIQNNYASDGTFINSEELTNKYEVYEADGENLGVDNKLYAVKCTCTTTGNTHFLWLPNGNFKNDPLAAIASTFYVYEAVIPHIQEITRHGDTWFPVLESTPEVDAILEGLTSESPKRFLTIDEYFGKMVSQA